MPLSPDQLKDFIDQCTGLTHAEIVSASVQFKYRYEDASEHIGPTYVLQETRIEPGREVYVSLPVACTWCDDAVAEIGGIFCANCQRKYDENDYE